MKTPYDPFLTHTYIENSPSPWWDKEEKEIALSELLTSSLVTNAANTFRWLCNNSIPKDRSMMDLLIGPTRYGKNVTNKIQVKF